jgi:hypothetical protein
MVSGDNNTTDEQDYNQNEGIDIEQNDESNQETNKYENKEGYILCMFVIYSN